MVGIKHSFCLVTLGSLLMWKLPGNAQQTPSLLPPSPPPPPLSLSLSTTVRWQKVGKLEGVDILQEGVSM